MKIEQVNFSDLAGGAARAVYRTHHALRLMGVDSRLRVVRATSGDWTVSSPGDIPFKLGSLVRPQVAAFAKKILRVEQHSPVSSALLPSRWPRLINESDADLVNLHWLCAEMMSVEDIGRIEKPVVWTLHDMWAFCGGEHVSADSRFREGYTQGNRCAAESGFDINRWVWNRKLMAWKKPLQIVAPSRWLANCVRQSALMRDWPVRTIANGIDTDLWRPVDKRQARELLRLPGDRQLLAVGIDGSMQAHHKGFDLLVAALDQLRGELPEMELVVIGQMPPSRSLELGFPVHYLGYLRDDLCMILALNAAHAVIIPSRIDNLPNMGLEALACGTPLIAFDTCGLSDMVVHGENGYLAKPFDPVDLATGVKWLLAGNERYQELCASARRQALTFFSSSGTAKQYLKLYRSILAMDPPESEVGGA